MAGLRRALILSTGERYLALGANFITLAVVSRLLTPAEMGVAVVGLSVVGLATTTREFAGTNLLIQAHKQTREEVRASVTVLAVVTAVVALALALAAPWLARVYGDPGLTPYVRVVAGAIMWEALGAAPLALLRRELAFGKVAVVGAVQATASTAATIGLAAAGASYMAFAWAWLISAIAGSLVAVAAHGGFWMFRPRLRGWRGFLAFGGYNGASILTMRVYEAAPALLIGRLVGLDAAALFFRTTMLCQLPDKVLLDGAGPVILPVFAGDARAGRSLRAAYMRGLELMTALHWSALLTLAALAYPVVAVLLGEQWRATAPLVQIVAVASLAGTGLHLGYPMLLASGGVRDLFLRVLIFVPVAVAIIGGAAFLGIEAVAWSMMLVIPLNAFIALIFVRRRIGVGFADCARATWRSALVALATAAGPVALGLAVSPRFHLTIPEGAIGLVLAAAGWLLGLWATRHPLFVELLRLAPPWLRSRAAGAA